MKKTSTFLYSLQFHFPVLFPNNDRIEISHSQSSTNNSHFSQFLSSIILNENATLQTNSKMSRILPALPTSMNTTTHSNEWVNIEQQPFYNSYKFSA